MNSRSNMLRKNCVHMEHIIISFHKLHSIYVALDIISHLQMTESGGLQPLGHSTGAWPVTNQATNREWMVGKGVKHHRYVQQFPLVCKTAWILLPSDHWQPWFSLELKSFANSAREGSRLQAPFTNLMTAIWGAAEAVMLTLRSACEYRLTLAHIWLQRP